MQESQASIGYVLKAFPVVSETFILNEIRAMEGHEVPLVVFSLKPPPRDVPHALLSELSSRVLYAPWGNGLLGLSMAHLRLGCRRPTEYWRGLRRHLLPTVRAFLRRPVAKYGQLRKRCRRFAWAGWIVEHARKHGVRHLHAHYAGEPLRVARLAQKLGGLPYSFTAHAKDLFAEDPERLRRRARRAKFAVTCHDAGLSYLREVLPEPASGRAVCIQHGLDTSLFRPGGGEREPGLVLAVGRLTAKKGFDTLISACARLVSEGRTLRCRIVGEGALESELRNQVREHGLESVIELSPFVAHEELPALYRRAGVFVMPSVELPDGNRDGVPNVLLEAMACGAPVVASAAGGIAEVVDDGQNGALVPPGDAGALASAIGLLLDDPDRRALFCEQASQRVAKLDFRSTNRVLAERWKKVLAKPVEDALSRAERKAWREKGAAAKAAKRLGIRPQRQKSIEDAIRKAVTPGIAANAWRPDLERLATRRLWDELYKAKRAPRIKAALNGSGELPGMVLDLGCGRGGLAVALKAHGVDVVALDLRRRNCAVTALRGERYGLEIPSVSSVGERLPFPDGSFNAVYCMEVLEHVQDPVRLLEEIRRVLSPRGACALTVINRWSHFDPHYHLWGINFLPRSWANRYIALRKRTKKSYRDCQTLDEMHYYSYRGFERLAHRLGFCVEDPERPEGVFARFVHGAKRRLSLGYNTAMLVVRPM